VTSARGINSALPIAETAMAAIFMFIKRLDLAVAKSNARDFSGRYQGVRMLGGKTLGIVGLGGIGSNLARLARGAGMRVVATRRSAIVRQEDTDGVDVLFPPSQLHDMLSECDFVAVCAMWTPETERMLNAAAFEALKPGAFLINISRGELIDEAALAGALESGKLAGAFLDVWDDDLYGKDPSPLLQSAPNIIFTGHSSGRSDIPQGFSLDLFCRNLEHLLKGEPLENVVEWTRGY
jgi:phosphoglycerate dehydrogenase-like enzyme